MSESYKAQLQTNARSRENFIEAYRFRDTVREEALVKSEAKIKSFETQGVLVEKIRKLLECPISQEPLVDPVITIYGHAFERNSLQRWTDVKQTCPLTNQPLSPPDRHTVYEARVLRDVCSLLHVD